MSLSDPARSSTGMLRALNEAGLLSWGDVHVSQVLSRLYGENDEHVMLALSLTVRALRAGSVRLSLDSASQWATSLVEDAPQVPVVGWPDPAGWTKSLAASPLVAVGVDLPTGRPLRLVDGSLYLERYWQEQLTVSEELARRRRADLPPADPGRLRSALDAIFPDATSDDCQRLVAAVSVLTRITVVAGGPGTGKTTTIAAIIALLQHAVGGRLRIALAAPTGKAAARVEEAIGKSRARIPDSLGQGLADVRATTLHRLLGWTPEARTRFVHDRDNPLPHDVVIVDEASMVSVTMMARLLEALRPDARLVLVGDPDQLTPVEAGAVLSDVVAVPTAATPTLDSALAALGLGPASSVIRLTRNWRFGGAIGDLADAIRVGDDDAAVAIAGSGAAGMRFVETAEASLRADVVSAGVALIEAARRGAVREALEALESHRLLCAHRRGPFGVAHWSRQVEQWLAEAVADLASGGSWYAGRPLLITQNAPDLGLYNGDTGVVVDDRQGHPRAWFGRGTHLRSFSPFMLDAVQTVHAMTVHKAQGSQFQHVSFLMPPPESPLLTRELLYTAVTRATTSVTLIGSEESLRRAVLRPAQRASGLVAWQDT